MFLIYSNQSSHQCRSLKERNLANQNLLRVINIERLVQGLSLRWLNIYLILRGLKLSNNRLCRRKVCCLLLVFDTILLFVNYNLSIILALKLMATLIAQGVCCCFACCCQECSDALKRWLGPEKVTKVFYLFLVAVFTIPAIVILFYLNKIHSFL